MSETLDERARKMEIDHELEWFRWFRAALKKIQGGIVTKPFRPPMRRRECRLYDERTALHAEVERLRTALENVTRSRTRREAPRQRD